MQATLPTKVLKQYLKPAAICGDEVTIHIGSDGFESIARTTSGVVLTHCKLHANAFDEYDVQEGTIHVNISGLKSKLTPLPKKVQLVAKNDGELHISGGKHSFTERLLDSAYTEATGTPSVELPFTVQVSIDELKSVVSAAALVADNFYVNCDGETLHMGGDTRNMDSYQWQADADEFVVERPDEIEGTPQTIGDIDYIGDAVGALAGDTAMLSYGDDLPLWLKSESGDGLLTEAVIAPKVRD